MVLLLSLNAKAQPISNYVANGSFEEVYNCSGPFYPLTIVKHWLSIDSASFGGGYFGTCNSKVPWNGSTYQFPRTGNAHIISTMYYPNGTIGYLKNRLRSTLQAGKTYCVKFYVNITNNSPRGMDGFGAYFGDNIIDTITKCNVPLTYLQPQVHNTLGNVISDTLNWVPITGTFVATGTEKYMLIGNFLADNAVTTASINTPFYPQNWTDVLIDDASCIDRDLPAYAGPDQPVIAGNSVYIGRVRDFAVDEACTWYQLPDMIMPIATGSGILVSPVITTTYVVKQEIDCSSVKLDTVVVYMDAVGMKELTGGQLRLNLFPKPTQEILNIELADTQDELNTVLIYNQLGQMVLQLLQLPQQAQQPAQPGNTTMTIPTKELPDGVYLLCISTVQGQKTYQRFVIAR